MTAMPGVGASGRVLDLVYNPGGSRRTDARRGLEAARRHLAADAVHLEGGGPRRVVVAMDAVSPRVSVVIPTLDEAARIASRLVELRRLPGLHEVIVVDGGSVDETVAIARAFPEVTVLTAARGRASQMNAGAAAASGDVLLFLHADVSLPTDALAHVAGALSEPGTVAGAFRTWTVVDDGASPLAPLLHLADLRSRYTTLPYGDQALFVRASVFRELGGFPVVPILEDLKLAQRLRDRGRVVTCPAVVTVSGRRFVARPLFYAVVMNLFPLLARLGVPLPALASAYATAR